MTDIRDKLAKIAFLDCEEVVDLHFAMQEEIKRLFANHDTDAAVELCERAVAISSIVMLSMKKKHIRQTDEYARVIGSLSPQKFVYPNHYAASRLMKIYSDRSDVSRLSDLQRKMSTDGWGSLREEELYFL